MNFPTENKKPASEQLSPREMIEAAMAATIMEVMQLRRTLWLVVNQQGKPVEIDETMCHPLWRMKFTRLKDGKAQLEALQLPDPSPETLAKLVELLHGSRMDLSEAMQQTDVADHPPAYIQMLLQSKIVQADSGYWVDAALAKLVSTKPTEKN